MAGQTLSINPNCGSSALFRAWGSVVSAAIATNGQVQTADTGQINWTTVTVPAANASGGYEIWRFADSLQSSAPVYIKLEYGLNSNSSPQMWVTVGTGSDGAGNITGAVSGVLATQIAPRTAVGPGSSAAANVATTSYVNGNSGCLAMLLFPNNNSVTSWAGFMLLVERTKDASGADTGDGLLVLTANSAPSATSSACFLTYLPGVRGPSTLANNTNWPFMGTNFIGQMMSMTVSGVVYPAQVFTGTGPKAGGPSQYVMGVTIGDLASGQTVAISHYGTSRNWYTAGMGYAGGAQGWGQLGPSGDMVLIRSFVFRIN